jgi:hypothetical protein
MIRRFLLAALLLVLALPASGAAQDDASEVMKAVDRLFAAMKARDTTAMAAALDSAARFTLTRPAPDGVRVVVLSGSDFLTAVSRPGGQAIDERIRNPVVQVDGHLATVWAEYQVLIEGKLSHCGYDAFDLVRRSDGWKVLNVSDTFRRECGEVWEKGRE